MRVMDAPEWQTALKKWKPLKVQPKTSYTVVGGREAKREQTAALVQGSYHLELEYKENRPGESPTYLPMCDAGNLGPYVDVRIYTALVFVSWYTPSAMRDHIHRYQLVSRTQPRRTGTRTGQETP